MAFRPPTFNLSCNIWRVNAAGGNYATPDAASVCALQSGSHVVLQQAPNAGGTNLAPNEYLLLPKLTDIRATWNGIVSDAVEVPAGSKRFYSVQAVVDIGKGWQNEYRLAYIVYEKNGNQNLFGVNTAIVPMP